MLSTEDFTKLVEISPLISIDLLVKDLQGRYLLGKRLNEPAKGDWFVPGGRVFKNETVSSAFLRIAEKELGVTIDIEQAEFVGVYEHFYQNSFVSSDINTHYIVLAYVVEAPVLLQTLPIDEHQAFSLFSVNDIMTNAGVHPYTRAYFEKSE